MPLEDQCLCSDCVGELFLSAEIEKAGQDAICAYCGEQGKTFSLGQMADAIEISFREHFYLTPADPDALESAMASLGIDWDRKGYRVADVIADQAGVSSEVAEDIRKVLRQRHFDKESWEMSEEQPFDKDAHYAEQGVDSFESQAMWLHFEWSLKTEARFFSRTAQETLASVFEGLAEHKTHAGLPVIVEAGPGTELAVLYRARVFQSPAKLKEALKRPDREVGPPPPSAVTSGRMNPHGIAVFYGAQDWLVALAEVRPPIGSTVVVGKFELTKRVRLLDVEALRSVYVEGSIFDRGYKGRLERGQFLGWLSDRISMPVMPDDEPFDYLPTQVIAEYLATEASPPLDGIIYPSVQGRSRGKSNVVLFHKAALVAALDIPEGTEISADVENFTEDGPEVDYRVWERVLQAKPADNTDGSADSFPFFSEPLDGPGPDYDERTPTLKLDVSSLEVHHVEAISFETDPHPVRRHRLEKSKEKF